MATTGYAAGVESNNVVLSYIDEVTWGTLPATPTFKTLRYTGESLGSNKTRQRAAEIEASRQAGDQVTTQFQAGGTLSGAMSIGTYDDLFESAFGADFATNVLTNGASFQSLYLQKTLASNLYLRYPGAYCTGFQISAELGGFVTVQFNIIAKGEETATTNAATTTTAANTNRIINTVNMVSSITLGGSAVAKVVGLTLDVNNENASSLYAFGGTSAAGILPGVFTANASLRCYFSDFTLYTRYVNETEGALAFTFTDGGLSYTFELLNSVVMNPRIVAGGPGQAVIADMTIEGKKDGVTGKTLRLTRDLTP